MVTACYAPPTEGTIDLDAEPEVEISGTLSVKTPGNRRPCHRISPATEQADWGYARNERTLLMTTSVEWTQSVYSCQLVTNAKRFIVPNRDYPYEGLLALHKGENWKYLDCVAVGLRQRDGSYLSAAPAHLTAAVEVDPWRSVYNYCATVPESGLQVPFSVIYYLGSRHSPEGADIACVDVYVPARRFDIAQQLVLVVQPFLDIRHMYRGSNPRGHRVYSGRSGRIDISKEGRTISFHLSSGSLDVFDFAEVVSWHYKLGSGSRHEVLNHQANAWETQFVGDERDVAAFFSFELPLNSRRALFRLRFHCGIETTNCQLSTTDVRRIFNRSKRADHALLSRLERTFRIPEALPFREAIAARIIGLIKFKVYIRHPDSGHFFRTPPAGAMRFKTPWYRDVFEGILSNFETLMRLQEDNEIRGAIQLAISHYRDDIGLLPGRIPEFQADAHTYNSSDATLLCFITAHAYVKRTGDLDFAREVLPYALRTIECFRRNYAVPRPLPSEGPPRLDPTTGLLLTVPHHSWIDSRSRTLEYAGRMMEGLPNRASASFTKKLFELPGNKQAADCVLLAAAFFLPEINAQWLTMLAGIVEILNLLISDADACNSEPLKTEKERVIALLSLARRHFKQLFWDEDRGFLYNLVDETGSVRDEVESETTVTAAAMLGRSVFQHEDLLRIWNRVEKHLLVYRTLQRYGSERLPFGILTQNEGARVYYDDGQYHADVVWPRSTPYLIKLLDLLGNTETIRQVLVNNLDHQMTEGAVFYNQELFSLPFGNNPHPDARTQGNPVPVKNPIQFWSQWCDVFLDSFEERSGNALNTFTTETAGRDPERLGRTP
jgi:hypothetical protein